MYLANARPWIPWGQDEQAAVLVAVAEDHADRVNQIADYIQDLGGVVVTGEFPMEFTDLHDLSVEYILKLAIRLQRQDVARIEQLAAQLADDARARAIAEEALGAAKGHLQSLEECLPPSTHGTV
jgi:hypothetical protein